MMRMQIFILHSLSNKDKKHDARFLKRQNSAFTVKFATSKPSKTNIK